MEGCVEEPLGHRVKLACYFSREDDARTVAESFKKALSVDNPVIEFIADNQDWNAKWRESMEPVEIAAGIWVSPGWLEPPEGRVAWIRIEPKMAFGTGHHETTRLAAQSLIDNKKYVAGKKVLDIGTGSGILCFVANYLGAKSTLGIEIDGVCLENLAENLRGNPPHPKSRVNFAIGTLDAIIPPQKGFFDVITMNMISTEAIPLLPQIKQLAKDDAVLIWSGILTDEGPEMINLAESAGFEFVGLHTENEWECGIYRSWGKKT
jgi:ribosomal protein L11 methyltransferase